MNKFFAALMLMLSIFSARADQNIFVVWPWSLGDSDAQFSRLMMEHMNKQQKEMNFVYQHLYSFF